MNSVISATSDFVAAVFILGCIVGSFATVRGNNTSDRVFVIMLVDLFVMLVSQGAWYLYLYSGIANNTLEFLAITTYYGLLTIYVIYVWSLIREKIGISRLWLIIDCVVGIAAVLYWFLGLTGGEIIVSNGGTVTVSSWYIIGQVFGYILIIISAVMIIIYHKCFTVRAVILYMGYIIVPLIVSLIRSFLGGPNILNATIAAMIFIIFTLERVETMQASLKQRSQVSEMELSLMIQQVQPHFLYNILNSIYHLCGKDPESAQEILGEFSDYLRANLNAITSQEPVPLSRELETVKQYVHLEQVRFEDHLNVEYDINCQDFTIPPLSVRPLVENAIKHGVNKVDHPLHIKISSMEYPDRYEVTVADDGPGYREGVFPDDGRKHLGISNLRKRLDIICGGMLEISGQSGKGTTAVIKLKKE